ncbi:phage protein [hydrocarbon metagenome]|uniref:Phage protein n=1 Tax=hydrocarbon metagenome TaxID=938273 RepID=A0A0W8E870_9ZZZZ
MKVIILGDLHGEFERLNCLIKQEKPDIIMQVGDFGYWPRIEDQNLSVINSEFTSIFFCDGNNDDLECLHALVQAAGQPVEITPGIYYMPRGSILTLEDGRRVLFMGGAQSIDKYRRFKGWDWFPQEVITEKDLSHLPDSAIDIVISHTCPQEFAVETFCRQKDTDMDPSRKFLSQVLHKYQPDSWYFGHWHTHAQGQYQNTKWEALSWAHHWNDWYRTLPLVIKT